jgi:hypothetical protein
MAAKVVSHASESRSTRGRPRRARAGQRVHDVPPIAGIPKPTGDAISPWPRSDEERGRRDHHDPNVGWPWEVVDAPAEEERQGETSIL